jgi:hypothetical protein
MSKNWEKILKDKTSGELYRIYSGQTPLGAEAIIFAKNELRNRNIDLENINKYEKKWELERLIKQNEEGRYFFGSITSSKHFLVMAVTGALVGVITIFDVFLETSAQVNHIEKYRLDEVLLFGFSIIFMIFGFLMFRKEKKREEIRNKRIRELIDEL